MKKKKIYQLILFLVPLTFVLSYFSWKKWLVTNPQLLPAKPTIAVSTNNSISNGTYYEVSISPLKEHKYLSADYRIWIPNNVKTLRGLIVKQHGCGDAAAATGLNHANDLQWQALALKHQFALLGTKYSMAQRCEDWVLLNSGSDGAFLQALRVFSQKSHHPELNKLPWVLYGHSGGADWNTEMLQKYPERIIAVVQTRGGGVLLSGKSELLNLPNINSVSAIFKVPVLFAVGEKDPFEYETRDLPKQIFFRYRKAGALWALALEANAGHESGDTRLLAIPYLDAIITERLTPGSSKLRPVNTIQGWLGNTLTHEVAPVNQYQGNLLEAAWLPNEETARKWQQYVTTGKITPTQKPAAPTDVNVTRIGATDVLLRWSFTPDLENGLPPFRIYRNNSLIQTLQGQEHSFGDAPVPPNVVLEFRDRKAPPNSTYSVAAFNQLGETVSQSTQ